MQNPYRHQSPPQNFDPTRQLYGPIPPPPPVQQQGVPPPPAVPPPPPRQQYPGVVQNPMLPGPPGTAPPGIAAMIQNQWPARSGNFYNQFPQNAAQPPTYNPSNYSNYQDSTPMMSSTYIPTGDSFGPGVGIPSLGLVGEYAVADDDLELYGQDAATLKPSENNATSSNQASQSTAVADGDSAEWPLERVLTWLADNNFSRDWQETFSRLNLYGSQFLDLGRTHGGKGDMRMLHQVVYPQLAYDCNRSGSGWDQARELKEGRRLRRLISDLKQTRHRRSSSQPAAIDQPRSPSTAGGAGEHSPLPDFGTPEFVTPQEQRAPSSAKGTNPIQEQPEESDTITKASDQPDPPVEQRNGGAAHAASTIPRNANTTPSREIKEIKPEIAAIVGSDALKSKFNPTNPNGVAQQARRATHFRGRSSESNGPRSATSIPGNLNDFDPRRVGLEGHRPSSGEPMPRNLTPDTASVTKDHRTFMKKFFGGRQKNHDPNASPDENTVHSPSSPVFGFFSKKDNSVDRPSVTTLATTEHEDQAPRSPSFAQPDPNRKFVMVTPDAWNYRLIDISAVESIDTFKDLLRYNLSLPDVTGLTIHFTLPGQLSHLEPLSNENVDQLLEGADHLGSLKLFIKTPHPVAIPTGASSVYSSSTQSNTTVKVGDTLNGTTPDQLNQDDQGESNNTESPVDEVHPEAERRPRSSGSFRKRRIKDSPSDASSPYIQRRGIINFDHPRTSPFEASTQETTLVPHRKPPPAPQESSTLIKANSLSKKNSTASRNSYGEPRESPIKRLGELPEIVNRGRRRAVAEGQGKLGVASALAGAGGIGTLIGAPSTTSSTSSPNKSNSASSGKAMSTVDFGVGHGRRGSPGGSPRSPGFTMSKGKVPFKIPAYEEEKFPDEPAQSESSFASALYNDPHASPDISPATEYPPTLALSRNLTRRGPTIDFKEPAVPFERATEVANGESDNDDSDDGLFSIPLEGQDTIKPSQRRSEAHPKSPVASSDARRERPLLSVKTPNTDEQMAKVAKPVQGSTSTSIPSSESSYEDAKTVMQTPTVIPRPRLDPEEQALRDARRPSFPDDGWAPRPPPDVLVDHLDDFFPNVDLDAPVLENGPNENAPGQQLEAYPETPGGWTNDLGTSSGDETDSSITSGQRSNGTGFQSVAQRQLRKTGGLGRTKSIRDVVKEHYQHPSSKPNSIQPRTGTIRGGVGDIVRRRSTKMFGARIEQIKPPRGSRLIQLETIPQNDIPQDTISVAPRQRTFQYIKGDLIGKGSFGRVYLGFNYSSKEFIAIKQVEVNPHKTGQDKEKMKEMVKALDQEIDTMQHLDHVNIVQYLGCERKEFSISIFLEYISGGSIGSCLRKHGKFEEPVVSSLTRQTLNGLAYLHHERILHRDLKADNILLDVDGTCKISDFGISKRSDDIYGNDASNSMQGSVFWMAPEVVRSQGQGYSAKVDIWSLGCVVLEMFAGKRPWSREEVIGAMFKLGSLNEAPPIPDDVASTISPAALSFMYDCFNVDPADRPTADNLLRAPFCFADPHFNFLDTELYAKIRPY